MKKGDKVKVERIFDGWIFSDVTVTQVTDTGFYGTTDDPTNPWTGYNFFYNTTEERFGYKIISEPWWCGNCGEVVTGKGANCPKCGPDLDIQKPPVYMDDGVIKFNTTSLQSFALPEPKQDLKDYLDDDYGFKVDGSLPRHLLGACEPLSTDEWPPSKGYEVATKAFDDFVKEINDDTLPEDGDWQGPFRLGYANLKDIQAILNEFNKAYGKYGDFASFHEGYAVLLEEVDELWDHVKVKETNRDNVAMKHEVVQVAAMALKLLHMFK